MTDYSTEGDLKYISGFDDMPLRGPDKFTNDEKLEAAELAEAKLEADVNEGYSISQTGALHDKAANAYASYLLFFPGQSPESARSGQLTESSGDQALAFARELKSVYHDMRDSIVVSDGNEGKDSSKSGSPFETLG